MSTALVGIIVSVFSVLLLSSIYRIEHKRGSRFLEYPRHQFDALVENVDMRLKQLSRYLGGAFLRQLFHYFFHALLYKTARILTFLEDKIQSLLRSNRLLAKRAEKERTTRNMLDEIAEHRAATAFTDEERKQRKEDAINRW